MHAPFFAGWLRAPIALTTTLLLLALTPPLPAVLPLTNYAPVTLSFSSFTAPNPWSNDGGTNGALNWQSWAFSTGTRTAVAAVFGESVGTGMGVHPGGTGTAGIYAFQVAPGVTAWGLQATGSFGSPGSLTLRVRNATGETLNSLSVSYTAWFFNDAPRAGVLRPYYSWLNDGTAGSYLQADGSNQDVVSPEAPDVTPAWIPNARAYTLTGLNWEDGTDLFLRWGFNDSGSGTRDEWAISSITLGATMEPGPVVINEIMYHPLDEPEELYEYVELFNRSDAPVDLTGWVLRGVDKFDFSSGTILGAGEFLVAAGDPASVMAKYGLPAGQVVGPWTGKLKNSVELLRLVDTHGAVVDWVEYRDVEPWPVAADGLGPSLERLDAGQFGGTPANWQSSLAETNWVQVIWTQTVSEVVSDVRVWASYTGLFWLDDVSVRKLGEDVELLPSGDFESGGTEWIGVGNHERSRVEPGVGRSGNAYGVAAKFTRIIQDAAAYVFFGDEWTNHVRSPPIATDVGQAYVVSCWVRRGSVGGLVYVAFGDGHRMVDFAHHGTPGAVNSRTIAGGGVAIVEVDQEAVQVGVGVPNRIAVRVEGGVDAVTLEYRVVASNTYAFTSTTYEALPMTLNSGGWYEAVIPGVATNRSVVLYRVVARDEATGVEGYSPRFDDPSRDWAYWVESNPVQTVVPNWHILVDGGPVVYSNALFACAVSPDGQVFPHAIVRHRGRVEPSGSAPQSTGFALRMNKGRPYQAYWGEAQTGINFRHRRQVAVDQHRRTVNEYLAYRIQAQLGLTTPFIRHVCIWVDGAPTITMELEDPGGGFLSAHDLPSGDYVSRAGYTGRNIVDGDATLDNWPATIESLVSAAVADRTARIRENLWLEPMLLTMAINAYVANGDQAAEWNMFQHRRADNGLWTIASWDTDLAFEGGVGMACGGTLLNMHPYYETPLHGNMWDCARARPLAPQLFYPEEGPDALYTLPYRHRHQMNLWRLSHTLLSPRYAGAVLDELQTNLLPAFEQLSPMLGQSCVSYFTTQVAKVKTFIGERRDWLYDGAWSDKDPLIWDRARTYEPQRAVISEIMADDGWGGPYIELHNPTEDTIDCSWWALESAGAVHRIPHGTLIAPSGYVVVAVSQMHLTNSFAELGQASEMLQRNVALPLWDYAIDFLTRSEHRTRVVECPVLSVPESGATVELRDWESNVVCRVAYSSGGDWPVANGWAWEWVAGTDPEVGASWRRSFIVGTPGAANTADDDMDGDGLPDSWEQRIVDHFEHIHDISEVLPIGDEDGDGISNWDEYWLGLDPTAPDDHRARLFISLADDALEIHYPTAGVGEDAYIGERRYSLDAASGLCDGAGWMAVSNQVDRAGSGEWLVYTNRLPTVTEYYRCRVRPISRRWTSP